MVVAAWVEHNIEVVADPAVGPVAGVDADADVLVVAGVNIVRIGLEVALVDRVPVVVAVDRAAPHCVAEADKDSASDVTSCVSLARSLSDCSCLIIVVVCSPLLIIVYVL